jgi:hypothetical protein
MLEEKYMYIKPTQDNEIIAEDCFVMLATIIGLEVVFLALENYHKTTLLSCFKKGFNMGLFSRYPHVTIKDEINNSIIDLGKVRLIKSWNKKGLWYYYYAYEKEDLTIILIEKDHRTDGQVYISYSFYDNKEDFMECWFPKPEIIKI